MSNLKTKIDEILSERKSRINKISSQSELIGSLYPNLEKIQKTISELGVEGADEKAKTIEAFLTHLDQAREKLRLLKKRYAKDTINIGVSASPTQARARCCRQFRVFRTTRFQKPRKATAIRSTQQPLSVRRFSTRRKNTQRFSIRPTRSLWIL